MSRYLDLADRALESIVDQSSSGCGPMDKVSVHYEKNEFNEKRSLLNKLRTLAGKDWDEISSDPAQLKAFCELMMITEMRCRGQTPDHYTSTTTCKYCGPVPIWDGCPSEVQGCPWCLNRHKGLPIRTPIKRGAE